MNVWSKLLTAMRGTAYEAGEAVVDSQALRILDQEIRDADAELHKSREALANIMAKQKLAGEKVAKVAAKIAEYEQYAIKREKLRKKLPISKRSSVLKPSMQMPMPPVWPICVEL